MGSWENFRRAFLLVAIAAIFIYLYNKLPTFREAQYAFNAVIPSIVEAFTVIIATSLFVRLTKPAIEKMALGATNRQEDARQMAGAYNYAVWFLSMLFLLMHLTGGFASLSVFLGLFTAGLAFALQQPILNVVGWITLMLNRPFRVGDRITIGQLKGDVIGIRLFYTILEEFGGELGGEEPTGKTITVPNATILQQPIVNYTATNPYLWDEALVSVTYESDLTLAGKILENSAKKVLGDTMKKASKALEEFHAQIGHTQYLFDEPQIRIELGPSSVDMRVRYLCDAKLKRLTKSKILWEILEQVNSKSNKNKVEIAYPHTQLVVRRNTTQAKL